MRFQLSQHKTQPQNSEQLLTQETVLFVVKQPFAPVTAYLRYPPDLGVTESPQFCLRRAQVLLNSSRMAPVAENLHGVVSNRENWVKSES